MSAVRDSLRRAAAAVGVDGFLRRSRDRAVGVLAPGWEPPRPGGIDVDTRAAAEEQALLERSNLRDIQDNEMVRLLLAFVLQPDSSCIDVGAHEGIWLEEFRRRAPLGKHLAYEPIPQMCELLVERFPEMDVRNAALSDSDGEVSFVHVRDLPGFSGLRERDYPREVEKETITVRTERLDDHLPAGLSPALIMIDVEGAEQLVVHGALETIRKYRPIVVFEHGPGAADKYGTTPADMYALLCEQAGLELFDFMGNGPLKLDEFEHRFWSGRQWSWIARP